MCQKPNYTYHFTQSRHVILSANLSIKHIANSSRVLSSHGWSRIQLTSPNSRHWKKRVLQFVSLLPFLPECIGSYTYSASSSSPKGRSHPSWTASLHGTLKYLPLPHQIYYPEKRRKTIQPHKEMTLLPGFCQIREHHDFSIPVTAEHPRAFCQ